MEPRQVASRGEALELVTCCVPGAWLFTVPSLVWGPHFHWGVCKFVGPFTISIFAQVFNKSDLSAMFLIVMVLRMTVNIGGPTICQALR